MRTIFLLVLGITAIWLLSACSGGASAQSAPAAKGVSEVLVKDMRYTPGAIEVPAGTTVTWRFQDGQIPHDVKGDAFQSEVLRAGAFTHTFSTPGSHDYHCTLHPGMTGRVIVTVGQS